MEFSHLTQYNECFTFFFFANEEKEMSKKNVKLKRSAFFFGISVYYVYMHTLAVTKWRDKWQMEMTSVQMNRLVFQATTAWLFQNKSVSSIVSVHWPFITFMGERMCDAKAHVPCNRYDLPKCELKKTSAFNAWCCSNSYIRILHFEFTEKWHTNKRNDEKSFVRLTNTMFKQRLQPTQTGHNVSIAFE